MELTWRTRFRKFSSKRGTRLTPILAAAGETAKTRLETGRNGTELEAVRVMQLLRNMPPDKRIRYQNQSAVPFEEPTAGPAISGRSAFRGIRFHFLVD
jgi:hypothetical protein